MRRFSSVLDYLTRAHPTEGDFTLLLQSLAREGHDYEVLGDWSEAQRIWSERVDVAKRRLDWEQQRKIANMSGSRDGPLRDLCTRDELVNKLTAICDLPECAREDRRKSKRRSKSGLRPFRCIRRRQAGNDKVEVWR